VCVCVYFTPFSSYAHAWPYGGELKPKKQKHDSVSAVVARFSVEVTHTPFRYGVVLATLRPRVRFLLQTNCKIADAGVKTTEAKKKKDCGGMTTTAFSVLPYPL
jgi:hypothetical protein